MNQQLNYRRKIRWTRLCFNQSENTQSFSQSLRLRSSEFHQMDGFSEVLMPENRTAKPDIPEEIEIGNFNIIISAKKLMRDTMNENRDT